MKKHIIIAGVPRSEKSTLSQKISKDLGYQHISMDSFPETGIDSDADTDLWEKIRYISSKMSLFICAMMDSGEYDECGYEMVIDIFQLLPEHLCRTYNLPYFYTSYNRKRIFETILSDVDVVHFKKDYNYLLECT